MPSRYFIITDTHFCHKRIVADFCFRPHDFEKKIIKQWRSFVRDEDTVFHMGDVTWGSKDHLSGVMSSLPGTKVLIRGNHDKNHSNNWFIDAGFSIVVEKIQVSGILLSHKPSLLSQEEIDRGVINVHGHFHNNPPNRWEENLKERITDNHYLLSLEDAGYRPFLLEDVRRRKFVLNSKTIIKSNV